MARVELNKPAPPFELADFTGESISLEKYRDTHNVVLVFNRGFT